MYMVTFTINIPQMLAYIPYMDPMGFKWFKWSPDVSSLATKIRDFIHQQSGWKKLTKQNGEIIDKYDVFHQASNMGFSVYKEVI